ncbi:MAG: hypothetical protein E7408_05910 [Ruminococcaceae bacterium]|nr:hypothetical protein [Oscillospiraceae bacterium]
MKRNKVKKILHIGVFVVLLAFLFGWYLLDGRPVVLGIFQNGAYGTQLELDTSFEYIAQKYNGGVAVFGKEGLTGITNGGRIGWKIDFAVTDPILSCNGRYVLAAERGGKRLVLSVGGKVQQDMEMDSKIISATVNSKGVFAVVTEERGYKGRVKVYNAKGKELYAWHSAEQNILGIALSEDSKQMAISVVNMTDLSRLCTVMQFNLDETTPRTLTVGDENLVANLIYNGKDLLAVGDEALYYFKNNGTEKFRLDYAGRELQKFSFYSGGVLCTAFNNGGDGVASQVEFYDTTGKLKGSCAVNGEISDLDTFGKYAVVTGRQGLMVIGHNGKIKAERYDGIGAEKVFLCGSRNRVFLLGSLNAGMYIF